MNVTYNKSFQLSKKWTQSIYIRIKMEFAATVENFEDLKLLQIYDPLLQSFREKTGGLFEYFFDEKEARDVVLRMGQMVVRPQTGTCDCKDANCPHKGDISPLAMHFLRNSLHKCLRPKRALDVINFDAYVPKTVTSVAEADQVIDTTEATYYRFRMAHHWLAKENRVQEALHRRIFEVIEGVELPENHQITRVCYQFSGPFVTVKVEKDQRFIRCPFPIFLHYLVFSAVNIIFDGAPGDFEFFLIGGAVPEYPHLEMPAVRIGKARYQDNLIGILD